MPTVKFTNDIITAAIEGFEYQKRRIDDQIAELRAMLPGGPSRPESSTDFTTPTPARKRRKFSAAARRKMAQAQKARWARIRGESESSAQSAAEPVKPKRRISEEGMKRIIAAAKKRWRLQKAKSAAAKKAAPGAPKKATAKKAGPEKASAAPVV